MKRELFFIPCCVYSPFHVSGLLNCQEISNVFKPLWILNSQDFHLFSLLFVLPLPFPLFTQLKFVSNLTLIVFSTLLLEHVGRRSSNCGQQSEKHSTDQIITSPYEMKLKELQLDCSGSAGSEIKTTKIIFLNQILFFFSEMNSFWVLEPFEKFLKISNRVCIACRKEYILRNTLLGNFIFV